MIISSERAQRKINEREMSREKKDKKRRKTQRCASCAEEEEMGTDRLTGRDLRERRVIGRAQRRRRWEQTDRVGVCERGWC